MVTRPPAKTILEMLRVGCARSGNVTITAALLLIPMIGLVGAAVDYSRANSARTAMQTALDSTALMLSKEAATLTPAQLEQKAKDYFTALYHRPDAGDVQVTPDFSLAGGSLTLNGSAAIDTTLMRVLGQSRIPISASSTVMQRSTKLRVALVLDNTGSMNSSGKIGALKTASHQLLQMLQGSARNPGDVQVAIIPFAVQVNVGVTNINGPWLDVSNIKGNANSWKGCVADRDQPYDTQSTAPNPGNPSTLFPADNGASCPTQLMALSSDWTALNNKIDQMVAQGTTNQTIGLAWGWQALTAGAPLNPAPPSADMQQIIVLLTDGMNTQNRWSSNQAEIDLRTKAACANVKAAGIQLYTVLVMSGNSSILQSCATNPNMYFALTNSGQIITTFNAIGTQLSKLRIAR